MAGQLLDPRCLECSLSHYLVAGSKAHGYSL